VINKMNALTASVFLTSSPLISQASTNDAVAPVISSVSSEFSGISTLSRQLSASAQRAELRDDNLSRKQLSDLNNTLVNQFSGQSYFINKIKHDSEVPTTLDPELIARAHQATEYVNKAAIGDKTVSNPFAGLQRDQLALISYDDSGRYTVNERRAASYRSDQIEQEWRKKFCAMAMDEYHRTGSTQTPKILAEMLSHYQTLPRIEQAQFPEGYAAGLQIRIDHSASDISQ